MTSKVQQSSIFLMVLVASLSCGGAEEEPDIASFQLTCSRYHTELARCSAEGVHDSQSECIDELQWLKRNISKDCSVATARLWICYSELDCESLREGTPLFEMCSVEVEDVEDVCAG